MGTAFYRREVFKGRTRVSDERPQLQIAIHQGIFPNPPHTTQDIISPRTGVFGVKCASRAKEAALTCTR